MGLSQILAQAAQGAPIYDRPVVPVEWIWSQITELSWLQAVLAVSFGIVYMLYGWRIFRILVVISFGLIGMVLGIMAGQSIGGSLGHVWGGVLGCALLAFVSVPLMKWCVCLLGAAAGGILTGGLWYALDLPEVYIWAGAAVGAVAGGMISFIVLKVAVMLFTSLGGSAIVAVGALSLLYHLERITQSPPRIHTYVHEFRWFLPTVLIVPTIFGIIMQNRFIKHSHKWEF